MDSLAYGFKYIINFDDVSTIIIPNSRSQMCKENINHKSTLC